jgi:DnaJ-class molecular chaperone
MTCPECHGEGCCHLTRYEDEATIECNLCLGSGEVEDQEPDVRDETASQRQWDAHVQALRGDACDQH